MRTAAPPTRADVIECVTRAYGPVAAASAAKAEDHALADLRDYAERLTSLDDTAFTRAAETAIFDAATANRFRGFEHLNAKADMCAADARRRHETAGHSTECRGANLYNVAYNRVVTDYGYASLSTRTACTCGTDTPTAH